MTAKGIRRVCGAPFERVTNGQLTRREYCSDDCRRPSKRKPTDTADCRDCGAEFHLHASRRYGMRGFAMVRCPACDVSTHLGHYVTEVEFLAGTGFDSMPALYSAEPWGTEATLAEHEKKRLSGKA